MCVLTDYLVDDLFSLVNDEILFDGVVNTRQYCSNYNAKKTAASALYMLSVGGIN